MFAAGKREFEYRFWIYALIFYAGFSLYRFDHVNTGVWLAHLIAPGLDLKSAAGTTLLRLIFAGGALLAGFAAAVRTWATAYLRTEIVHDKSLHSGQVVADGPFRYTRNPLYFGSLFLAAGMGVMASRLGWVFIVCGVWVLQYRLIRREEAELLKDQGESYRRYFAAVPRLLPSLRPRLPGSGARPRWAQSFAGESLFWLFALSVLCYAVTLEERITWIVTGSAFVVYFSALALLRRRSARQKSGSQPAVTR